MGPSNNVVKQGSGAQTPLTINSGWGLATSPYWLQIVNNSTFEPFVIFSAVAAIYFVLCYPLSVAARTLERRAHAGR